MAGYGLQVLDLAFDARLKAVYEEVLRKIGYTPDHYPCAIKAIVQTLAWSNFAQVRSKIRYNAFCYSLAQREAAGEERADGPVLAAVPALWPMTLLPQC